MMESSSSSGSTKRARAASSGAQAPSCLVDGCTSDLSKCRDYHRRHKVCEDHSKTPKVTIRGQEQRFCQQCSRSPHPDSSTAQSNQESAQDFPARKIGLLARPFGLGWRERNKGNKLLLKSQLMANLPMKVKAPAHNRQMLMVCKTKIENNVIQKLYPLFKELHL